MAARCDFVDRHHRGTVVDVGIGCGAFVELRSSPHTIWRGPTYGYDVNPAGIKWLKQRKLFFDPYRNYVFGMTLWDVLEHIPDYRPLLASVRKWLFVSLPVFRDAEHALRSKHFRPQEHCWYFTRQGLITAMAMCGFELKSESDFETQIGREDIGSFAFKRET